LERRADESLAAALKSSALVRFAVDVISPDFAAILPIVILRHHKPWALRFVADRATRGPTAHGMDRIRRTIVAVLTTSLVMPAGCQWRRDAAFHGAPEACYDKVATQIEYPAESPCTQSNADPSIDSSPPVTLSADTKPNYWDVSLQEVIQLALANSEVLRDLGGAVVRAPESTRTTVDAAIAETNPQFGTEAALSAFDAQFSTSTFWEKNDRLLNNEFFGGGTRNLQQDDAVFQAAITKKSATGSQFTIRHNVEYDSNNAPGNQFPSVWDVNLEAEIRQPILQGAGLEFNRIAGPNNTPGQYNGVLVARINTDVALTDFEIGVRDLSSNVENAYWDLYYGYRDLDAKVRARDAALDTWRKIYAQFESGRSGGEADKEAEAREQYFRFQEDVQTAMNGELLDATRTNNGSPGGTFRPTGGVLVAERKLRLLIGLAPSDGRLMRPSDEPAMAKVEFDWAQASQDAVTRRAELRREKWQIRRRELEVIASKNYLLPRLDAVGRYRWRGLGDQLVSEQPNFTTDGMGNRILAPGSSAYGVLDSGDFQEWQLGFEYSMPIGFRQAHSAVRNAELILARERALLRDQQRDVIHELADAVGEMDRGYTTYQTSYNRLVAARQQLGAVQAAYEAYKAPLDLFLDAQRRLAEAESNYYRALATYAVDTKNVHYVKGTLLEYDGVCLSEGPWCGEANKDAAAKEALRGKPRPLNYASSRAPVVSWGAFPQVREGAAMCEPGQVPSDGHALPLQQPPISPPPVPPSAASNSATGAASSHDATPVSWAPTVESGGASTATQVEAAHYVRKLPATGDVRTP
jgi:outer membrane protein TolC